MTQIEAQLLDFKLIKANGDVRAWSFRFGKCEEFKETMMLFKRAIPSDQRKPFPEERWRWEVDQNPANYRIMQALFDNFPQSIQAAVSQMNLWGD